jgi:hypothetical protein
MLTNRLAVLSILVLVSLLALIILNPDAITKKNRQPNIKTVTTEETIVGQASGTSLPLTMSIGPEAMQGGPVVVGVMLPHSISPESKSWSFAYAYPNGTKVSMPTPSILGADGIWVRWEFFIPVNAPAGTYQVFVQAWNQNASYSGDAAFRVDIRSE